MLLCCGCGRDATPSAVQSSSKAAAGRDDEEIIRDWPALPSASSPFLNVTANATYVGSQACQKCHQDSAATYHHTAMSVSMLPVDPEQEPPDGEFDHALSGCRYTVERREGAMWHRESILVDGTPEILAEYPVKYVVGSGRHSRTYLVEAEGFLVESPITWYSELKRWGMSPGYDRRDHLSFERATGQGCLECHAGRTAPQEKSLHRMTVMEAAIGCERCHGPGSLHLERHRDAAPVTTSTTRTEPDYTIVNPAHLSRELSEAICQQCHLRSTATIIARDHDISDFRPGLPLMQFRHDYRLEVPNTPLTVVSHVEQMRQSQCYLQSESMTCRTCHNPHAERDAERQPQHFNAVCANCHAEKPCRAASEVRSQTTPTDNCIECHMPRGDTEIPHLAFTHHRITKKPKKTANSSDMDAVPTTLGDLRPLFNLNDWSPVDRKRSLGLAYVELARRVEDAEVSETYYHRAFAALINNYEAGYRDLPTTVALAQIAFKKQSPHAETFAKRALEDDRLTGLDRCQALFILGDAQLQHQQPASALPLIQELTSLRRHPVDWLMRAQAERAVGQDFVTSLETAVRIAPSLSRIHETLAEQYSRNGDAAQAERHRRLIRP